MVRGGGKGGGCGARGAGARVFMGVSVEVRSAALREWPQGWLWSFGPSLDRRPPPPLPARLQAFWRWRARGGCAWRVTRVWTRAPWGAWRAAASCSSPAGPQSLGQRLGGSSWRGAGGLGRALAGPRVRSSSEGAHGAARCSCVLVPLFTQMTFVNGA